MSRRELIVADVVQTLKNAEDPRFGLVTREPFDVTQLSRQQFPALYISTADEAREDITQTGTSGTRQSRLQIRIVGYVNGTTLDTLRNDLVERVEEVLDTDRTRGGQAYSTQLIEVSVDYAQVQPYGRVELLVEIVYTYRRGLV
jgi:hypothetical protein